jgi:N-acyl homoserine lactone hydrolase
MSGVTLRPFNFGTLVGFEKSVFTLNMNQGVKLDSPCLAFVVDAGGKRVLMDTGPGTPEEAWALHRYKLDQPVRPAQLLEQAGIPVSSIDAIVLSHLHWDHCYNLEQFPDIPIYVQRLELQAAIAPVPAHEVAYEVRMPGVTPPWAKALDRIVPIVGDVELFPGIRTVLLPSHSAGSQGLAVQTDQGVCLLPGDMVPLYENLQGTERLHRIPSGIYVDLEAYFRSFEKMDQIADLIIPSHDPAVLEHAVYPLPLK